VTIARLSAVALLIALILMGCVRSEAGDFSIHLLADEVAATELSVDDLDALELQEQALVSADDIVTYSRTTHEIELTAEAYARIGQLFTLPAKVRGIPFVVSVGPDRIYAGAFWTPVSSISFDGVVIGQPFDVDKHVIKIGLGYPSSEAFSGQDPRSDQRILQSLEAAGKLR
jgi:hypothetical protein